MHPTHHLTHSLGFGAAGILLPPSPKSQFGRLHRECGKRRSRGAATRAAEREWPHGCDGTRRLHGCLHPHCSPPQPVQSLSVLLPLLNAP
ncbi:unnamed protein product [Closterium sp. NIES-54]